MAQGAGIRKHLALDMVSDHWELAKPVDIHVWSSLSPDKRTECIGLGTDVSIVGILGYQLKIILKNPGQLKSTKKTGRHTQEPWNRRNHRAICGVRRGQWAQVLPTSRKLA